jgi:hypothetical protein
LEEKMKKLLGSLLLIMAGLSSLPASAYSPSREGRHTISPMLGFMGPGRNELTDNVGGADRSTNLVASGFFGIGADYEYGLQNDFSVGGLFRYYSSNDTIGTVDHTDTAFLLGGLAHAQFYNTDKWNAYLGSGLTLLKVSAKLSNNGAAAGTYSPAMTLGIPFAIGLGYKLNDQFTLGIEHLQVLALGDKVNGWPVSDLMFRLSILL